MADLDGFTRIFEELKPILATFRNELDVVEDVPDNFYLNTNHIMPNKKPLYFGSVKINKNYVSFHLMPVYVFPELLNDISEPLRKRMQGKSCFNFKKQDNELIAELTQLTQSGMLKYKSAGYVR